MLLIETMLALASLALAFAWPTLGKGWFEKIESAFSRLANRRGLAVVFVGVTTLALRAAVLPVEPIPQPCVHDEFAYLLQADTFAHGRLTNPTPPMWKHFETFHVLFQPTYCSKYFPGQALFLAFGQIIFGHPFWGVWLSSGFMCAAITWMLQAWVSEEWSLLGGVLSVLRFGVFGYWADSYWGGNVAAIAGSLVLGAVPRIKFSLRAKDSVVMALGLVLLAYSRPWEGFVLGLSVAVILFLWLLGGSRPSIGLSVRRVVLPACLVLAMGAGWLAYYCWRTTGTPIRTPYQVYERTYGGVPYMVWQHVHPEPTYRYEILRKMNVDEELAAYRAYFSVEDIMLRAFSAVSFFLGPILVLPFLLLFLSLPRNFAVHDISPRTRLTLVLLAAFAAGSEMAIYYNPHYSAVITGLIIAFVLIALQRLRNWNYSGVFLSRAIVFACVLAFCARVLANPLHVTRSKYSTYYWNEFFQLREQGWFPRADFERELESLPGDHLVMVRYSPDHNPFPDWVANGAEIDGARVVWARDSSPAQNQELFEYFKHRQVWLLQADAKPPRLSRYPDESAGRTPHYSLHTGTSKEAN